MRIRVVVAASACAIALVIAGLPANRLILAHYPSDGIVSFVSIHRYPKARDVAIFYLALILLPAAAGALRWAASRLTSQPDSGRDRFIAAGGPEHARSGQRWSWKPLVLFSLLFYVLFLGRHHFSFGLDHDIDMFHEGDHLSPVESFLRGDVPFRDFFLTRGLIDNLIKPWVAVKLFGASVATVRILNHLIAPLAYVAALLLATQLFDTKLGSASVPVLMFVRGDEISDRYLAGMLALAFVAAAIRGRTSSSGKNILWLGIVAGALTVVQILWSLEVGLYVLAASLLTLGAMTFQSGVESIRSSRILLLAYGLGAVVGISPFAWYLVSERAVGGFFVNCLVQTSYQLTVLGLPYPPLLHDLTTILGSGRPVLNDLRYLLAWYVPLVLYLAVGCGLAVVWVNRRFEDRDYLMLLIWLAGVFAFRSALGRSDNDHLKFSMPFFWMVVCLLAERLALDFFQKGSGRHRYVRSRAGVLSVAVLIGILFLVVPADPNPVILGGPKSSAPSASPRSFVLTRAGCIEVTPEQAEQIVSVVSFLQANVPAGEPIFDFSNQSAYYFLADRPSATKYQAIANVGPRWMQLEVIRDLERTRPRVVIFRNLWKEKAWADAMDGIDKSERYSLVADYLRTHFAKQVIVGQTILLLRTTPVSKDSARSAR